jgi:MFS family permease
MRTDSDAAAPEDAEAPLAAPTEPARHDPYAALRVPNYRRFLSGWVFASMGLQMQGMALGWEVYERTHSAFHLGLIGLCRALPVIALALPAGQIVDTLNRKTVLIWTQFAFAFVSAGIVAASYFQVDLVWLYALVILSGCARVFNGPSRSSLLPQIIPAGPDGTTHPETFHNAVTWNSSVFHLSAVAGPLMAGQVIHFMQSAAAHRPPDQPITAAAWPVYLMTCLGCLIFGVTACFLHPRPNQRAAAKLNFGSLRAGMLEGARHVWREKTILGAITLDLFAVLLGGATALLPVYAKDILHVGPVGLGALKAAPYLGAVVMSLVLAHRPPFRRAGFALLWSVAGFGLCIVAFGLSRSFWLSIAILLVSGALDNISVVIRHVLVQMRTPEHVRGRVSAVNSVFIESSNELGAFESGVVAVGFQKLLGTAALGAIGSVVSGGVGTILVVAAVAIWLPEVRRLTRLREEPGPS